MNGRSEANIWHLFQKIFPGFVPFHAPRSADAAILSVKLRLISSYSMKKIRIPFKFLRKSNINVLTIHWLLTCLADSTITTVCL